MSPSSHPCDAALRVARDASALAGQVLRARVNAGLRTYAAGPAVLLPLEQRRRPDCMRRAPVPRRAAERPGRPPAYGEDVSLQELGGLVAYAEETGRLREALTESVERSRGPGPPDV
jgi:hypothetical protein